MVGDAVAALLVANLAVLAALAGMYVLARDRLSEAHARRSILYLVLSPYAFALAMAYSEGPFLALTVWMFVLSDRRARPGRPCRSAFAAGLTRVTGLALVAPLALRAWRRRTVSAWLLAAAPVAGVRRAGGLAAARGRRSARHGARAGPVGRPSRLPADQPGRPVLALRHHPRRLLPGPRADRDRLPGAARPALSAGSSFRATRAEDVLFVCGIFAMPLLSSVLQSVGRFGLVAFPLVFVMADIGLRRESWHRAYVVFAPTAQIVFFTSVALGYRPP